MLWKHVTKEEFMEHIKKYDPKQIIVECHEGGLLYGYKPHERVWQSIAMTRDAYMYATLEPVTSYYIWIWVEEDE